MHKGRAIQKAIKLAEQYQAAMAVVECGAGEYTVKRLDLAQAHYPGAIKHVEPQCTQPS